LSTETQDRVEAALQALTEEPRPPGCRRSTNRGGWRIRLGDYHIVYEIGDDQRQTIVLRVAHRRDDYRRG
ncbi:MAG TPA: type II toxin-antitoxin system RelE/ParE family toxin, partial [Rubrobacter sp.]|nr:type II toxin-antitoxin system RelE/ParE family toxin [Rubrobacter sp.]